MIIFNMAPYLLFIFFLCFSFGMFFVEERGGGGKGMAFQPQELFSSLGMILPSGQRLNCGRDGL